MKEVYRNLYHPFMYTDHDVAKFSTYNGSPLLALYTIKHVCVINLLICMWG